MPVRALFHTAPHQDVFTAVTSDLVVLQAVHPAAATLAYDEAGHG